MVELTPLPSRLYVSVIQLSSSIRVRGQIETDPSTSSNFVTLSPEYPNAPCLISILTASNCLFIYRSKSVSNVYQHRWCEGEKLQNWWKVAKMFLGVARSMGSLRKNSKRHCCWGVNTRLVARFYFCHLLIEQARTRAHYALWESGFRLNGKNL